jgi:NitT/TauT family transport system substrate-binding protein
MKKIAVILMFFTLFFSLASCAPREGLSVIVPSGSPALSQIYVQQSGIDAVDVVNGADPLVAAFGSGSHDIIFAPTNLGAKMIASGSPYVFAASVVLGNYHLVTSGKASFTLADLEGATIVAFGQNQTSDIILRHVLDENGIAATITYVDAVSTTAAMFAADPSLIVLTAEPSLAALRAVVDGLQTIDLQTEYALLHGDALYPQAGVFVKTGLDADAVDRYLKDLKDSIDDVVDDPAAAAAVGVELGYGFTEAVMTAAVPGSHLIFLSAEDSRTLVETYFSVILEMNPALIGGELPGDSFYYVP